MAMCNGHAKAGWEGCNGLWMAQLPNLSEGTASDDLIKRLSTGKNPQYPPTPPGVSDNHLYSGWLWFSGVVWLWDVCRGSFLWRRGDCSAYARPRLSSSPLAMSYNALRTAYQHLHHGHPHPPPPYPSPLQYAVSSALPWNCPQWLETLEEGGLGLGRASSLPVGFCPSEGFPTSSNSQDWQQFLIPPFAFLATTMVCKASCSGQSASCFWDAVRRLHNMDMSTWNYASSMLISILMWTSMTWIFLSAAAAGAGGAGVWLVPACHPATYPSLYLGILWYATSNPGIPAYTAYCCNTNPYLYPAIRYHTYAICCTIPYRPSS